MRSEAIDLMKPGFRNETRAKTPRREGAKGQELGVLREKPKTGRQQIQPSLGDFASWCENRDSRAEFGLNAETRRTPRSTEFGRRISIHQLLHFSCITCAVFAPLCRNRDLVFYCIFPACAGEAGCHAGESPAGRIRLFTTESCVREEAARPNPKARRRLNCPVATTVNLIQ